MRNVIKYFFSYWSNLLEITRADLETKACQWWFHLYGLYKEGVAVGGANVLLEGLQQLMETSTVGEYTIRLSLLQSFSIHCYKGAATCIYTCTCVMFTCGTLNKNNTQITKIISFKHFKHIVWFFIMLTLCIIINNIIMCTCLYVCIYSYI